MSSLLLTWDLCNRDFCNAEHSHQREGWSTTRYEDESTFIFQPESQHNEDDDEDVTVPNSWQEATRASRTCARQHVSFEIMSPPLRSCSPDSWEHTPASSCFFPCGTRTHTPAPKLRHQWKTQQSKLLCGRRRAWVLRGESGLLSSHLIPQTLARKSWRRVQSANQRVQSYFGTNSSDDKDHWGSTELLSCDEYHFTQILYLSIVLRYIYFTWVFHSSTPLNFKLHHLILTLWNTSHLSHSCQFTFIVHQIKNSIKSSMGDYLHHEKNIFDFYQKIRVLILRTEFRLFNQIFLNFFVRIKTFVSQISAFIEELHLYS